jgi:hypothetical protein
VPDYTILRKVLDFLELELAIRILDDFSILGYMNWNRDHYPVWFAFTCLGGTSKNCPMIGKSIAFYDGLEQNEHASCGVGT